jgi:ERF superfamily
VERSESIAELVKALSKAQSAIVPASKDATNPHFKRRYADLTSIWEAARVPLTSNGLAVVQTPETTVDGFMQLRTTIFHESGEWLASSLPIAFDPASMQSLGSALTYARRYSLATMVGIVADEDDDGELAQRPASAGSNGHAPASQSRGPYSESQRHHGDAREGRDRPERRSNGDGPKGPPATGRALFGWLKDRDERDGSKLLRYASDWGNLQDHPKLMKDWDTDMVARAHAEVLRKFPELGGEPVVDEEALAN